MRRNSCGSLRDTTDRAPGVTFRTPRRRGGSTGRVARRSVGMDADLFTPADTAALLALRRSIDSRGVSRDELQAVFEALCRAEEVPLPV